MQTMNERSGRLGGLIPGRSGVPEWRRRADRQKLEGAVECAFRDRSGATSPLMQRWRHGRAELAPGTITVVPFVALGLRMRRPRTGPIEIPVVSVSAESRRASGLERLHFQGTVFEIDTGVGLVEWGLAKFTDIEWAVDLVSPAGSHSG